MKTVSQDWINEQKKPFRARTSIRLTLLTSPYTPYRVSQGLAYCNCKEALSFILDANETIIFEFENEFDIKSLYSSCSGSGTITIINANGTTTKTIVVNNGAYIDAWTPAVKCKTIMFSTSAGQTLRFEYGYINGTNYKKVLSTGDIVNLNYKSFTDIWNKSLPYQKVSFVKSGDTLAISKMTPLLVEVSQYPDEWVKLGCGFFFLDNFQINSDENTTTYYFTDFLSTLTLRYRGAYLNQQTLRDIMHQALDIDLTNIKYPDYAQFNWGVEWVGNPTQDKTWDYETLGMNPVIDRTVPETILMVAQTIGVMFYLGENNRIYFNSLNKWNYDIYSPRMYAVGNYSKVKFTDNECYSTISINRYSYPTSIPQDDFVVFEGSLWNYNEETQKYEAMIDTDGWCSFIPMSSDPSDYSYVDTFNATNNYVYMTASVSTAYYKVKSNNNPDNWKPIKVGTSHIPHGYRQPNLDALNLDLFLSYQMGDDGNSAGKYIRDVAHATRYFETNVRFDARFEVGDFVLIQDRNQEYACYITDIDATFNGGLNARVKGMLWLDRGEPILLKNLVYDLDNNTFSFTLVNNNNFKVEVDFADSTPYTIDGANSVFISALSSMTFNETNFPEVVSQLFPKIYDWGRNDFTAFFKRWILDLYPVDLYPSATPHLKSPANVIVFEEPRLTTAPIVVNIDFEHQEIDIRNENNMNLDLYLVFSSESDPISIGGKSTLTVDASDFPNLASVFYYYNRKEMRDDFYCYFKDASLETSNTTIILEANYDE